MALSDAIERAEAEGKALLAPVSQRRYLDHFRGILELAVAKRLIPSNPAFQLRPLINDQTSDADKRRPFTVAQIRSFFGSEFYRLWRPGCAGYTKADRDWRFWLPLMMTFMGMRPGEIASF